MTVQTPCPATVLADHFFRFRSLALVVGVYGLFVILFSLGLLPGHHAFGLANRPAGAVGGA